MGTSNMEADSLSWGRTRRAFFYRTAVACDDSGFLSKLRSSCPLDTYVAAVLEILNCVRQANYLDRAWTTPLNVPEALGRECDSTMRLSFNGVLDGRLSCYAGAFDGSICFRRPNPVPLFFNGEIAGEAFY